MGAHSSTYADLQVSFGKYSHMTNRNVYDAFAANVSDTPCDPADALHIRRDRIVLELQIVDRGMAVNAAWESKTSYFISSSELATPQAQRYLSAVTRRNEQHLALLN